MPRLLSQERKMAQNLTPSLEDYLETIYLLQIGTNEARVRDIATERDVKASSVTPALKRLADMGYLAYVQRESIRLTETGMVAARRVYAKHVLLFQFFHDILGMEPEKAREEACGLEHALSDDGMDRFVRFFESRSLCHPENRSRTCGGNCTETQENAPCSECPFKTQMPHTTLDKIKDGASVTIAQIRAKGAKRQEILDMGILPNVALTRMQTTAEGVLVDVATHEMNLTKEQTVSIVVTTGKDSNPRN